VLVALVEVFVTVLVVLVVVFVTVLVVVVLVHDGTEPSTKPVSFE